MHCHILLLAVVTFGWSSLARGDDEALQVRRVAVQADELQQLLGLDIYRYAFPMEAYRSFDLVFSEYEQAGETPKQLFRHSFTAGKSEKVELTTCFLKQDNTIGSALLSNEEEVSFRLNVSGCRTGGLSTIVRLPLAKTRAKTVYHSVPKQPRPESAKGTPLLIIQSNTSESGAVSYPYAELTIEPGKRSTE